MMIKFMTPAVLVLMLCLSGISSAAEKLNARGKKEMQAIEAVIQQNFAASNAEDVEGVMDTMTPYTPDKERFVNELKQFFDEVDCYTRLVSTEFVSAEMTSEYGPVVTVKVVQETLAGKDEEDLPYSEFRSRSAMLPPWELCEFELVLHKVRGKWKAHLMGGNVREVTREELQERASAPACKDGSCRLTNVSVR
jgi:hypothetical protein